MAVSDDAALSTNHTARRSVGVFVNAVASFVIALVLGLWWGYGLWQVLAGVAILHAVMANCAGIFAARYSLFQGSQSSDTQARRDNGVLVQTSILCGVVAATNLCLLLIVRLYYTITEAVSLQYPPAIPDSAVVTAGGWSLGLLLAGACLLWALTGDRRLGTCAYALLAAVGVWLPLGWPLHRHAVAGGLESGGASYLLLGATAILMGTVGVFRNPLRFAVLWRRSDSSVNPVRERIEPNSGLYIACGMQAVLMVLVVCYHVVVPIRPPWFSSRVAAVANCFAALCGIMCCVTFVGGRWPRLFIDVLLALVILAFGSCSLAVLPGRPIPLVQRYPEIMNALMIGFTMAMIVLTWAFMTGRRRRAAGDFTTFPAPRVVDLQRFAFLSGSLGLVAAALMSLWPRMRFVAVADDSIGRILAGFGGHLFMVVVMLVCARYINRRPFHLLALLAFFSTVGFMLLRMYPYSSGFG